MKTGISRRNLIKTSLFITAVSALPLGYEYKYIKKVKLQGATSIHERKLVPTRCILCGQGCPMLVEVIDGVIRHAYPNIVDKELDKYTAICGRPQGLITLAYNPDRLKYPLIREEGSKRGEIKFRRASWEEALDYVANRLLEIKRKYGPQAIAVFSHQGCEGGTVRKFFKIFGTPNVTKHSSTCHTSMDTGNLAVFGKLIGPGGFTNDYLNARLIVMIERNPFGGFVASTWSKLLSYGRRRGLRLIVVDPRFTETAEHADLWLPIKPGTDLAFLLAIMHVLVMNKWYDEEYVRKYTNASMLVYKDSMEPVSLKTVENGTFKGKQTYLVYDEENGSFIYKIEASKPSLYYEGEYEGRTVTTVFNLLKERLQEYTPEWASNITGISAEKIRFVAQELWENAPAASIDHGYKSVRWFNENRVFQALHIINILLGAVGRKGGVLWNHPIKPKSPIKTPKLNVESVWDYWKKNGYPLHKPENTPNLIIKTILEEKPYPIKAAVLWNQNLIGHHPGYKDLVKALEKLEFVVIVDVMPNETMPWADVILPHAYFFEEDAREVYDVKKSPIPYVTIAKKAMEPPFEVKGSYEILDELAKRLFNEEEYQYYSGLAKPASETIKAICEKSGIDYTKLYNYGVYAKKTVPNYDEPFKSGKPLPSPTGEFEIFSLTYYKYYKETGDPLLDPLVKWVEPRYMRVKKQLEDDEFIPVEGFINLQAVNTFLKDSKLHVDFVKYLKGHMVWIHPSRAQKLGLKEGDWIEIYNIENEEVKYKAQVHIAETVHPDIIYGFHGTNPGPLLDAFRKSQTLKMSFTPETGFNTNFLSTLKDGFTPYWGGAMLQDFIVKIRKIQG